MHKINILFYLNCYNLVSHLHHIIAFKIDQQNSVVEIILGKNNPDFSILVHESTHKRFYRILHT